MFRIASESADSRVLDWSRHNAVVRTLVMETCPLLCFLFQSIWIVTFDDPLLYEPSDAVHGPSPTRQLVSVWRWPRQVHLVDPSELVCLRRVTEANAKCAVEEKGVHDGVVRIAVRQPSDIAYLLDVELVSPCGSEMMVECPMEARSGVAVADEEE